MVHRERYLNTSLAKALSVLELFQEGAAEFTLSELARKLGARPGTLYPIVYTLQRFGYLDRDPETKRYRPGLKFLVHAHHILSSLDVREKAKPVLRRLAREARANAHLAIVYEDEVLYLDREEAAPSVVIPSVIGRRVPLHCTALGKVLLAHNNELQDRLLQREALPALTPHTITDPEELRAELATVRAQGYAVDWEEFHVGNVCVAAPVWNYRRHVVAALSISLAKAGLEQTSLARLVELVVSGAAEVSHSLGYTPAGSS
ncbi:MAG: IclR family transcriptional regulator [Candidatus Bipolaricaulota bacterium]|nr:IclR family transcriptional regulator [Candidatus Bipolaricaulota bacterium]